VVIAEENACFCLAFFSVIELSAYMYALISRQLLNVLAQPCWQTEILTFWKKNRWLKWFLMPVMMWFYLLYTILLLWLLLQFFIVVWTFASATN